MIRKAGVLLHPTSFPGSLGMGDFGPSAYAFLDYISNSGFSMWQMLPINPVNESNSPYQSNSAFAGNVWLISAEGLLEDGLLEEQDICGMDRKDGGRMKFSVTKGKKEILFKSAFRKFMGTTELKEEFHLFCEENEFWVNDYSLFLFRKKKYNGLPWFQWPAKAKDRTNCTYLGKEEAEEILYYKFLQFIFFRQWEQLRDYAKKKGIQIICDIPMYLEPDSADVWANQDLFQLSEDGSVINVSGAPPDFFSATGQRWNGCLYDWERHKADEYHWWIKRFQFSLKIADIVRVDHFNGFFRYWSVPKDEIPKNGHWEKGPGEAFLKTVLDEIDVNKIIVEDVGNVTKESVEVKNKYKFTGMQVLQNGDSDFERENCVFYTGTHDNNTLKGWMEEKKETQKSEQEYIKKIMFSKSRYAFVQLQDILGEGKEGRMNIPGDGGENWNYQFSLKQLDQDKAREIRKLLHLSGRIGSEPDEH